MDTHESLATIHLCVSIYGLLPIMSTHIWCHQCLCRVPITLMLLAHYSIHAFDLRVCLSLSTNYLLKVKPIMTVTGYALNTQCIPCEC